MKHALPNLAPHAERFAPLPAQRAELWKTFYRDRCSEYFPGLVGVILEEVRADYARMRLPFRSQLNQPAGVMHGGVLATLIDTVVVPAIGGAYEEPHRYATVDMQVQYIGAVVGEDVVAEGWVVRRGRSIVFCRAEVLTASGVLVGSGTLVYKVSRL